MLQSRQIDAFRAVMRTGSMTSAADVLHVTQPAVSRLIRDLEAELGLVLFDRAANLVRPTEQAKALLAEVERAFIGLERIKSFADDLRAGYAGSLRICALPAMAMGYLPRFVARFIAARPGLQVELDSMASTGVRDAVANGAFDLGLAAYPFRRDDLEVTPLVADAVVALPPGHALAAGPCVTMDALRREKVILLNRRWVERYEVRGSTAEVLENYSIASSIRTPLASIACVLVAEGAGVAIVDPFSACEYAGRGLVLRRLDPVVTIGTSIVTASGRSPSVVAREFYDAFLADARAFLERADYLQP